MYCSMPYTHLYLDENGGLHLCCPGWTNQTIGNVLSGDPWQLWLGPTAHALRESVSGGDFQHCVRCQFLPGQVACVQESLPEQISTATIKELTLNYDPTCNLACPSCRRQPRGQAELSSRIHYALIDSGLLEHVEKLIVAGSGDPIASSLIWPLLCQLTKQKVRSDLAVALQTNGQLLTPSKWEELGVEQSRVRSISVSIDAASLVPPALKMGRIDKHGEYVLAAEIR